MAAQLEKIAKSSERTGAARAKAEADAAAATRLGSAAKSASDARIADLEKTRDYYKVSTHLPDCTIYIAFALHGVVRGSKFHGAYD